MKNFVVYPLVLLAAVCFSGCYQMHSDDDLRTIPVTNNPNIVPQRGAQLPGSSL